MAVLMQTRKKLRLRVCARACVCTRSRGIRGSANSTHAMNISSCGCVGGFASRSELGLKWTHHYKTALDLTM